MNQNLTPMDLVNNFAINIEKVRLQYGYSQEQMAKKLELSISAYKRLINRETNRISLYTAYKAYLLSNRLAYEYIGYSDKLVDTISKLKYLNEKELDLIESTIDYFLEMRNIEHKKL